MQTAYESLKLSQSTYYEQYRFAQVFGQLKRAPDSLAETSSKIVTASTTKAPLLSMTHSARSAIAASVLSAREGIPFFTRFSKT
jgi:hypothetical protein